MSEILITVNEDNCVGCNACVRVCKAPEANITKIREDKSYYTTVDNDRCINCGECVRQCMHNARDYIDDTDKFFKDIKSKKIILLVTPAIKTSFPENWQGVLNWLRKQANIVGIYDVSFGADICTWAHLKLAASHKNLNIITQPCAAIVNYAKKYNDKLLKNLSPIHSPISCLAVYTKEYLKKTDYIAVLSPCIAKKSEFSDTGLVDYNVTFKKLQEYIDKNSIFIQNNSDNNFNYDFDGEQGLMGSVYPRPGGLRDNLWLYDADLNITTSEGVNKVYKELDEYTNMPEWKHPDVFDVLSCEFGCNSGPASNFEGDIFDIMGNMKNIEKTARKSRKTTIFGGADKLFKKFDENLNASKFHRNYQKEKEVSKPQKILESEIQKAFASINKLTEVEQNYNCHACGYESCREMATAIAKGINVSDNCIVYAKHALKLKHEILTNERKELEKVSDSVNNFAQKLLSDIENIYNMIDVNRNINNESLAKSAAVNNIMSTAYNICQKAKMFDEAALESFSLTLVTIQTRLAELIDSIEENQATGESIHDAMTEVANATEELNSMVNDLVNSFGEH